MIRLILTVLLPSLAFACGPKEDLDEVTKQKDASADDIAGPTLLCRGGGDAKVTVFNSTETQTGLLFQFKKAAVAATQQSLQPGHCGWTTSPMSSADPEVFAQPSATDLVVSWSADGKVVIDSQSTQWVKSAGDANVVFLFTTTRDEKGGIVVEECQSITNAPVATTPAALGWTEKIDSRKFGLAPNANVDGKTLQQIVGSGTVGRDDNQLCSACHNSAEALGGYGVAVEKNKANAGLKPTDLVGSPGKTWAGKDGWAERFLNNETKPDNLKALMKAWIDGGYKQ